MNSYVCAQSKEKHQCDWLAIICLKAVSMGGPQRILYEQMYGLCYGLESTP